MEEKEPSPAIQACRSKRHGRKGTSKPIVAITMGDARGVGPEVVVKALADPHLYQICRPLILGDRGVLSAMIRQLGFSLEMQEWIGKDAPYHPERPSLLSLSRLKPCAPSWRIPEGEAASASFAYIQRAADMALQGEVDAIATGPVSKEAIAAAGFPFRGHTEFLAERAGTPRFVMMLAGRRLKVALVTTHLAYREVPRALRPEKIQAVIEITGEALRRDWGLGRPRIAVAALNPHGGEGGLFGKEEGMIGRAVHRARLRGWEASGPWPSDTLFYRAVRGDFDAVVSMYHDQGLIPLKLLHFDSAVNVTLGLPFVRTSVDHGIGRDIAGQGIANPRSMQEAIRLAARMVKRRRLFLCEEGESKGPKEDR